jgi:hypothetical protein
MSLNIAVPPDTQFLLWASPLTTPTAYGPTPLNQAKTGPPLCPCAKSPVVVDIAFIRPPFSLTLVVGEGPCKGCNGRIWASKDGASWHSEVVPVGSDLTQLAASPDTAVAGGYGRLLTAPVAPVPDDPDEGQRRR